MTDRDQRRHTARGRRWAGAAVALSVAATALGVAAAPAGAAPSVVVPRGAIGVSVDYGDGVMASYESWLGRDVDVVHAYASGQSWSDLATDARKKAKSFDDVPQRLLLSVPMRGSLSQGAGGAYDSSIRDMASALVDGGLGDTIIRPGWELNGNWFSWSAPGQASDYGAFFRRIVDVMRSVPGQSFVFEWNLQASRKVDMASYPGDGYVDVIGYDVYDQSYSRSYADPGARWDYFLHRDYGLDWLARFAAEHRKPVGFSEWAVSDQHLPGITWDNPTFVQGMYDWIRTHDVAYASYFERTADWLHKLTGSTRFPQSAATYRRLFGSAPPARTGTVQSPLSPAGVRTPTVTRPGAAQPEVEAPAPPPPSGFPASTPSGQGLWVAEADGSVRTYGDAPKLGSLAGTPLTRPIVGLAATPSGKGFWLVASDGGIFSFGDAAFYGSTGAVRLNQPIVGIAATPSGKGYWMVASDGGIFSFGDAAFYGSTGAVHLNRPIVGMQPSTSGQGYWLVASDGGIFSFGDAGFYGSTGAVALNQPIVAMSVSDSGQGYRFVASDGGVFTFGDAAFYGAGTTKVGAARVAGLVATPSGKGYWLSTEDGRVIAFGDATDF